MEFSLSKEKLSALIYLSKEVNTKFVDLDTLLQSVMDVTTHVMEAEASSLVLIDDETGDLLFHVAQGEKAKVIKTIRMKMGEGIVGMVAKTGKPAIVNNPQNNGQFCKKVDDKSGFQTKTILCVPLKTNTRLWGAIEVLNKLDNTDFDESDLIFCEAIASQVSITIENAMLHKEIVNKERLAAVGQTVAGLAHRIKNVLNGIQGGSFSVDLGIRKNDQSRLKNGWEIVKKNMTFLQELVLDMLTYAKERKPEYEVADLNGLMESICTMIAEKAKEKNISVVWNPCSIGQVVLDPKGMRRSLLNLVSNAVDACEGIESGKVQISSEQIDDKEFRIVVSDNGSGIPKEVQSRLFQMFFSTKGSKGTGLGLAVTHKIITEHQGKIEVNSETGKGTRFIITLPWKKELPGKES